MQIVIDLFDGSAPARNEVEARYAHLACISYRAQKMRNVLVESVGVFYACELYVQRSFDAATKCCYRGIVEQGSRRFSGKISHTNIRLCPGRRGRNITSYQNQDVNLITE